MFKLLPDLTKKWIQERISDEEIFSFYLNEPVRFNDKFCSPLRQDTHPTCNYFVTKGGTIYMKDHSGHFVGNCYDLVMFMYNIPFYEALMIIAKDFQLIDKDIVKKYQPKEQRIIVHQKANIQFTARAWNKYDKDFWSPFGINRVLLRKFNVYPVQDIWLNNNLHYTYNANDPAFAYLFSEGEVKIYFPFRKNARFICNTNILQGYNHLPDNGPLLIITKSYKDIMVLDKLGIPSIAPQSETQGLSQEQYYELSQRFDKLASLYDFDLTGIRTANNMKKTYNIEPFFLTNGRFGSEDYGAKDVSDYVKAYGYDSALNELSNLTLD